MGSEITYAEVNFKNGPSPVQPKASSENKTHLTVFQKLPTWIPWVTSGVLLLLSIVLLIVILVFFWGSCSKNTHLKHQPQKATDWNCLLKSPEGKEQEFSCCIKGWERHGSSCYYFSQDTANWVKSRLKCTQMGSDLVVINSEAEQDFLKKHAEALSDKEGNYWIGLRDQEQQNKKWQWVDDTPLNNSATFWRKGEPSNHKENCTVMHVLRGMYHNTKKTWNDIICIDPSHYICEAMAIIFY